MFGYSSFFDGSGSGRGLSTAAYVYRLRFVLIVALVIDSPVDFGDAASVFDPVTGASAHRGRYNSSMSSLIDAIDVPPSSGGNCANPQLFKCPGSGRCIPRSWLCDGDNDCGRSEDEINCLEKKCNSDEHQCLNNHKCIPLRWLCDSEDDCGDGSDEHQKVCANRNCTNDQFPCKNSSQCIPITWKCDGQPDCGDESDEKDCETATCLKTEFKCDNGRCIFQKWRCDHDNDCGDNSDEGHSCNYTCKSDQFQCKSDNRCIPDRWQCDGEPDCFDHSDERNCTQIITRLAARNITCNPNYEFQCGDGPCIHKAWLCDGDNDCPDGSDEENCNTTVCTPTEFMCSQKPLRCIAKGFHCNGIPDCVGGVDEKDCPTAPPTPKSCDPGTQFDCGDGVCIALTQVCDKIYDCPKRNDESPAVDCSKRANADYCANRPCDSSAVCVKGADGPICICPFGFKPRTERNGQQGKIICEDIDECKLSKPKACMQTCRNTPGSFICSCQYGYMLMRDKKTCRALGEHAKLWLSNRVMIREIDLRSPKGQPPKSVPLLFDLDSAVAMDYSRDKNLIFWTDVAREIIYRCKIPSEKERNEGGISATKNQFALVTTGLSTPDGMAVDWIHDLLYWTDTGHNTISVIDFNGTNRRTLIDSKLDEPRAIALDPRDGVMFWSDWGAEAKIERASMDGNNRMVIIKTSIQWPNGLAIDYVDRRIFWADAKLKMISSCNYDGGNRMTVLNSWGSLRHPFSLAVFEEKVYWTDWDTEGIHAVNKYTGELPANGSLLLEALAGPMTLRIYQEQNQPMAYNKCKSSTCEQLCLPAEIDRSKAGRSDNPIPYTCQCRDGYTINADGVTCIGKDGKSANANAAAQPHKPEELKKSGGSAAVAVAVIGCLAMVGACVGFLIWRRNTRNPRRAKRLNFENPVYRRTVVDDSNDNGGGGIHYDHLRLSVDTDQYNPTIDSMSAGNASRTHGGNSAGGGGGGGGSGSGVYQPTTTIGAESVIGVGVVQNGKYSMTLPLTEHEEGSDYA